MLDIEAFLKQVYYGQTVADYTWCVGIILGTLLLKRPIANLLTRMSGRMASRMSYLSHKKEIRDMLLKPVERLLEVVLFYVAFNQVSDAMDRVVIYHSISRHGKTIIKLGDLAEHILMLLFIVFLTQVITRIVDFVYVIRFHKAHAEKDISKLQLLPLMRDLSKLGAWLLCIFWALGSVFHVNVPALITGLGIGGVAIALAGKETVENFFAAFTILSDKPFQVGESVRLADLEGTVERIGFRSTRIRGLDGSLIILPNQKLVSQHLINLSERTLQGMKLFYPILYDTTAEQLTELVAALTLRLHEFPLVTGEPEISVDTQKFEFIQIKVEFKVPYPLPDNGDIVACKREMAIALYGVVAAHAHPGGDVHLLNK